MSDRAALVVGASSGVGRALSERLATDGWSLVIASRDQADLESIASDLQLRHGASVVPRAVDLAGSDPDLEAFCREAHDAFGHLDVVLIPAGAVADVDEGTADWATTGQILNVNLVGVVKVAGWAVDVMEQAGQGTVVLFSSIAAAAPRRRNVAYAASKAGLESYGRSMHHRLDDSRVGMQVYALGYVDTPMTAGKDLLLPLASPSSVADRVVDGLGAGSRFVYEPRWWRVVVAVTRALPWFIYRRLDF